MAATIRDVAARAGVSVTTVSNYLGGRMERMRPATQQRIEEAIAQLGFQASPSARELVSGKSKLIGIVLQASNLMLVSHSYFSQLLAATQAVVFPYGYQLLIATCNSFKETQEPVLRSFCRRRTDGVIITNRGADDRSYQLLEEAGIPFVSLMRFPEEQGGYAVTLDYEMAGRLVADHLLDLGHRRLGLLTGYSAYAHHQGRAEGFRARLRERGIDLDPGCTIETDGHPEAAAKATRHLLSLPLPPTAIFATNDFMAVGVMAEVQRLGWRVPQDLSVAGSDGSEFGQHLSPSLTTIRALVWERARLAAEMLLKLIAGERPEPAVIYVPAELVVRESTGKPPEQADDREMGPASTPMAAITDNRR